MSIPAQVTREDSGVLRWGGAAGFGGGLLLIAVFAIVIIFAGPEPAGPHGPIQRFPEIRAVRTVENSLYLAVMFLWLPLAVSLGRCLRRARPAPALFGSALNLLGLALLAAGALPHVVTVRLSDLYHAPAATPDDKATLALVWQAVQGMFDALLLTGLLAMAVGVVLLGVAMHSHPAFGGAVGKASVALGGTALAASAVMLVDPATPAAALAVFALIGFHLLLGWRTYRVSRLAEGSEDHGRSGVARAG
jgi:Domain of unknown function (DUF4386)